jgi:hypothetical protein
VQFGTQESILQKDVGSHLMVVSTLMNLLNVQHVHPVGEQQWEYQQ